MKLLLGLGNIGSQYANTRHNLGFMIVDQLAVQLDAKWKDESKLKAQLAVTELNGEKLILAKPSTMMNLSGESGQRIMQFYKIAPQDLWVVFDDLDVPFGRLRLRRGGSGSGHQGINSLIRHIGPDFTRLKAGISLNDRTVEPSEVYVLRPFNADEHKQLPEVLTTAADLIGRVLTSPETEESTFSLL